jgi:hypothetical protein
MSTDDMDFGRGERASLADAAAIGSQSQELIPAGLGAVQERSFGAQRVAVYRDEARILQKLKALAQAAGEDYFYRFPVWNKKENRMDVIEGGSIKLANDLARTYGNCDIDTRVVDQGSAWVFYARFTDFETGFSQTRAFQQRKGQASVKTGSDRAADIAFQIGQSKAIRNVVLNSLQTFADFTFEEARNSLVQRIGLRLDHYRDRLVARFSEMGIELSRVQAVIGKSPAEWVAPDVARLIAMVKSITDGMATADETFPDGQNGTAAQRQNQSLTQKLDALAAGDSSGAALPPHDPDTGEIISPEMAARVEEPAAESSQPVPASDPELEAFLAPAKRAATQGAAKFKLWIGRLNAPDYARIEPYLGLLREQAAEADAARE